MFKEKFMRINFLNYDGVSKCTREEMLRVLDLALETLEQKADMEVNVAFVTEDEIQNINKKQREKRKMALNDIRYFKDTFNQINEGVAQYNTTLKSIIRDITGNATFNTYIKDFLYLLNAFNT